VNGTNPTSIETTNSIEMTSIKTYDFHKNRPLNIAYMVCISESGSWSETTSKKKKPGTGSDTK
jgi:hypothetical protein